MVTGLWKSQAFIARGLIYYLTYMWGFRSDDPWGFKSQLSHFSPSSTIEAAKVKESLKVGVIGLCLFSIRSCPAVLATWHQLQIARTLLKAWLKRKQQQGLILTYMGRLLWGEEKKLSWGKKGLEFSSKILTDSKLEFWEQISRSLGRIITRHQYEIHGDQLLRIKKRAAFRIYKSHYIKKWLYIVQELEIYDKGVHQKLDAAY